MIQPKPFVTKRELAAMMIMQGLSSYEIQTWPKELLAILKTKADPDDRSKAVCDYYARFAVMQADSLLAELKATEAKL